MEGITCFLNGAILMHLFSSEETDIGLLELKKTKDFGKTFKTIGNNIYSFGLGGRFLFASVMIEKVRKLFLGFFCFSMDLVPLFASCSFFSFLLRNVLKL